MDIREIKGIGEKTAMIFNRLSIYTTDDLIGFYPRDYDVYEKPVLISSITKENASDVISIDGIIAKKADVYSTGKFTITSTLIRDIDGNTLKCTWFNMPFLRSTLRYGERHIFRGHIASKSGQMVLEQPTMYTFDQYDKLMGTMQPIYPLTKGLTNNMVTKAVKAALKLNQDILVKEFIPIEFRKTYNLSEHNFAINNIHFPKTMEEYIQSRKRLSFEEFFLFVMAVRNIKSYNELIPNSHVIPDNPKTSEFISNLEFDLTNAQLNTWNEIKDNMSGKRLMSRLIQGDVGSGKTIVAVLALMNTAYAGFMGAMMVPTEVLANQQYDSIKNLFKCHNINLNVVLLTGSMKAKEKKQAYEQINSGYADIVIGTHALIQDKVEFKNLGLVITDEQHRFGVNQRHSLSAKGNMPHVLVMSATPIPRTLAIIVYGDLDISIIDEMPVGRLPIKNCVVDESYRPMAYDFIENQVAMGRQAYIICPMVEESEKIDAENVIEYSGKLKEQLSDNIKVEYLHGKMKSSQKNDIMERFSKGEIDVLVSTTVIEVGVNVPNATVMIVENADRFGLAQLHQLRGRVGRGKYQSYCIFVSGNKSKDTKKRLQILNDTNDGFKVAEEDLKLRGPGDFFGTRQSGDMDFKIGDIFTDSKTLKQASDAADKVYEEDPFLEMEKNWLLRQKVEDYAKNCLDKINL